MDLLISMVSWTKRCATTFRARLFKVSGAESSQDAAPSANMEQLRFPQWPPPNPREMLARREFYAHRLKLRRYRAPKGVFEDSPLYALYRLYEWIMVDHTVNMRNELEMFWWNRWPVSSIPDPGEHGDPERYAVLACITALIVTSFNERERHSERQRFEQDGQYY